MREEEKRKNRNRRRTKKCEFGLFILLIYVTSLREEWRDEMRLRHEKA